VVFLNDVTGSSDLQTTESAAPLKTDWIKPELRYPIVSLDMYMLRLVTVARIKEEPVRADFQYRGHGRKSIAALLLPCQRAPPVDQQQQPK